MIKKIIYTLIISPFLINIAFADQLVIRDSRGNAQSAYTLQTENLETCLETAKNISNLEKFKIQNYSRSSISSLEYICLKGTEILKHGYIYQILVDKNNEICLKQEKWSGLKPQENCLPESRPILMDQTLYDYFKQK